MSYLIQNEVSQGILKNCVTRIDAICVLGGARVDENARADEKPLYKCPTGHNKW